ncbi:scavenger mRNA decapping enzyme carboxy-term-binding protein [Medicago truncatula]|uniref:Scavenger mRNA decapping enzyme carboxy-term-binding protein n=1 Tax=Medicago truncatula TaxID=3880 RepID=A0A072UCW9_MEDTR|nr:scavenger mRNA decapping enzyme carboxy-term-binding protein [Medicago truncatula]
MGSNYKAKVVKEEDDKVVAFRDINPSAFRHYLVVPVEHIPTVKDLQRRTEDYSLVSHMLDVGKMLLVRDAPHSKQYRVRYNINKCFFNTTLNYLLEIEK